MSFRIVRIAAAAAALFFTLQVSAQNAANPIQVALKRWYQINQVTQFPTCQQTYGLAFDGAHIWVGCYQGNKILELNASDGTLVRTVTSVSGPIGLLYDGANIWVSSAYNEVIKIKASSGRVGDVRCWEHPPGDDV